MPDGSPPFGTGNGVWQQRPADGMIRRMLFASGLGEPEPTVGPSGDVAGLVSDGDLRDAAPAPARGVRGDAADLVRAELGEPEGTVRAGDDAVGVTARAWNRELADASWRVTRPILFPANSVNHIFPSGPDRDLPGQAVRRWAPESGLSPHRWSSCGRSCCRSPAVNQIAPSGPAGDPGRASWAPRTRRSPATTRGVTASREARSRTRSANGNRLPQCAPQPVRHHTAMPYPPCQPRFSDPP